MSLFAHKHSFSVYFSPYAKARYFLHTLSFIAALCGAHYGMGYRMGAFCFKRGGKVDKLLLIKALLAVHAGNVEAALCYGAGFIKRNSLNTAKRLHYVCGLEQYTGI